VWAEAAGLFHDIVRFPDAIPPSATRRRAEKENVYMAVNIQDPAALQGLTVTGQRGEKLGKVDGVYIDNETQRPEWAAVKSGLFGTHISLVPLATADVSGDELRVPFDKDTLKGAPHHDPDRELSPQQEIELFEHYGIPYGGDTVTAQVGDGAGGGPLRGRHPEGRHETIEDDRGERDEVALGAEGVEDGVAGPPRGGVAGDVDRTRGADRTDGVEAGRTAGHEPGAVGHATSGPATDDAMTRSEERLHVGTERTEAGRGRLRRYVVTENVTQTVPMSPEEVRKEEVDTSGIEHGRDS
jgi:sporulation protein YlmC with PRC-barrel domain